MDSATAVAPAATKAAPIPHPSVIHPSRVKTFFDNTLNAQVNEQLRKHAEDHKVALANADALKQYKEACKVVKTEKDVKKVEAAKKKLATAKFKPFAVSNDLHRQKYKFGSEVKHVFALLADTIVDELLKLSRKNAEANKKKKLSGAFLVSDQDALRALSVWPLIAHSQALRNYTPPVKVPKPKKEEAAADAPAAAEPAVEPAAPAVDDGVFNAETYYHKFETYISKLGKTLVTDGEKPSVISKDFQILVCQILTDVFSAFCRVLPHVVDLTKKSTITKEMAYSMLRVLYSFGSASCESIVGDIDAKIVAMPKKTAKKQVDATA